MYSTTESKGNPLEPFEDYVERLNAEINQFNRYGRTQDRVLNKGIIKQLSEQSKEVINQV